MGIGVHKVSGEPNSGSTSCTSTPDPFDERNATTSSLLVTACSTPCSSLTRRPTRTPSLLPEGPPHPPRTFRNPPASGPSPHQSSSFPRRLLTDRLPTSRKTPSIPSSTETQDHSLRDGSHPLLRDRGSISTPVRVRLPLWGETSCSTTTGSRRYTRSTCSSYSRGTTTSRAPGSYLRRCGRGGSWTAHSRGRFVSTDT